MRRRLSVIFMAVLLLAQAGGVAQAVHHLTAHRAGHGHVHAAVEVDHRPTAEHAAPCNEHGAHQSPLAPTQTPQPDDGADEDCATCHLIASGLRAAVPTSLTVVTLPDPGRPIVMTGRAALVARDLAAHAARGPPASSF